jgi:hypothetical protein
MRVEEVEQQEVLQVEEQEDLVEVEQQEMDQHQQ